MSEQAAIGLFCGTFNPIHNAHLLLAQCACDQFQLQSVYFVTSPRPPHRQVVALSGEARHEMVIQAVSNNDKFIASTFELDRSGPSYTIDTIEYFKSNFKVHLIVGADNVIHLPSWHRFEDIAKYCKLLVAPRRIAGVSSAQEKMFSIEEYVVLSKLDHAIIDSPLTDISSSNIRERCKQGKTIRYMVPDQVWKIIEEKKYFQ